VVPAPIDIGAARATRTLANQSNTGATREQHALPEGQGEDAMQEKVVKPQAKSVELKSGLIGDRDDNVWLVRPL
jgi:hypothetical protein